MANELYCTSCGTIATPKTVTPGAFILEIVLWLMFLLPGLLYSLWRLSARHKACPACGGRTLIPPSSPNAQAHQQSRLAPVAPTSPPLAVGAAAPVALDPQPANRSWRGIAVVVGILVVMWLLLPRSGSRTPSAPSATAAPVTTGNRAHDILVSLPEAGRREGLLRALGPEHCDAVTRTFFQGLDKERTAFWNATCRNGRSYLITVKPDAGGSTKVLDCAVLKALAQVACFAPFTAPR